MGGLTFVGEVLGSIPRWPHLSRAPGEGGGGARGGAAKGKPNLQFLQGGGSSIPKRGWHYMATKP